MKKTVPNLARASLLLASLLGAAASLPAAVIFNFGPSDSYVSGGNRGFNRPAAQLASNPYIFSTSFNDSNPLRVGSADYSGPVFYGGYRFSSSTLNTGITTQAVRDNRSFGGATVDTIALQSTRSGGWEGSALSLHGVFIFKQEDFIGEAASGDLSLDGISLRASGSGNASDGTFALTGRFVVQVGDSYYVSETTLDLAGNNRTHTLDGASLASERWALYSPSPNLNFNQAAASFSALALEGVRAVGIYFENDGWTGTNAANAAYTFDVIEFSASGSASAIPEPSASVALFGAFALSGAALRRSRRA